MRGDCTTEDEPGTASYDMARPAREDSTPARFARRSPPSA